MSKPELFFPTTKAKAVATNYNGRILAVSLYDGSVFFTNMNAKRIIHSIDLCKKPIRTLKFVEQTSKVICGSDSGEIIIYDISTQSTVYKKVVSPEYIRKVVVHGRILFVGTDDGSTKIFFIKGTDSTTLKLYTELKTCTSYVMDMKIYHNRLFIGHLNGQIDVYDMETLKIVKKLVLDSSNLNCFELCVENETLNILSGFDNGVFVKTNYNSGKNIMFNLKEVNVKGNITNIRTNNKENTLEIYTDTGINYTTEITTFSAPTTSPKSLESLKRGLTGFSMTVGCVWDILDNNSNCSIRDNYDGSSGYVAHVGEQGLFIQLAERSEFKSLRLTDSVVLVIYELEIYRLNLIDQNINDSSTTEIINIDSYSQNKNFIKIGDIPSFPNRVFISSSGRYICLVFGRRFAVYTTRTFIKKLEGECEDVVIVNEDIVVLENVVKSGKNEKPHSIINVFKGFELDSTLKLENKEVVKLFGGKMLGIYYKSTKKHFFEILSDNGYTSILTLPGIVERVEWGQSTNNESEVILISKTFSYLIKLSPENETEKMKVLKEIDTQSICFLNNISFLYNFSSIKCVNYELSNASYIFDSLDIKETPVLYNRDNKTLLIENKSKRILRRVPMSEEWLAMNSTFTNIFYNYKQKESLTDTDKSKITETIGECSLDRFNNLELYKIQQFRNLISNENVSIKDLLEKQELNEEDKHIIASEDIESYAKEIIINDKQEEIKNMLKHDLLNNITNKYTKIELLSKVKDYERLRELGEVFKSNGNTLDSKLCFILCGEQDKKKTTFREIIKK